MISQDSKKALTIIISLSLLLHLSGLVFVLSNLGVDPLIYGDAKGYIELSKNLKEGNGFMVSTPEGLSKEFYRTPGLPIILMPFIGGNHLLAFYFFILTILASFLLPLLTWYIGKSLFNERVGTISAFLVAFEPMLIFFSWFPLSEIPFLIFSLASISLIVFNIKKQSFLVSAFSGILASLAVYIRPGLLVLFLISLIILSVHSYTKSRKRELLNYVLILFVFFLILSPWYFRTYKETGVLAFSAVGWRTVYADYLPSIRALKNGTEWIDERNYLKDVESKKLGLDRFSLNHPSNSDKLKGYVLPELFSNVPTIIKLEAVLLVSFFTNDGYYYTASNLGFMERLPKHISPTKEFLDRGIASFPDIFKQLKGQLFIPILGRIFTVLIFLLALIGILRGFRDRHFRVILLLATVVFVSALSATAIGFGVEARLRLSTMPILMIISAVGIDWIWRKKPSTY